MATIKCPECGYEMNGSELNCPKCGCPFTEWTGLNDVPLHKGNEISNNTQAAITENQGRQRKNGSKHIAIAITFSVIAVALAVLCVYFWVFPKKGESESEETLRAADQKDDSSTDLENHNLSDSGNSLTHTETDYEGITEQRSEYDGITVYWFMPSGFSKAEDGLYHAPDYPNDIANINVMGAIDDQETFQYTQDSFCEAIEYSYKQLYDYEVDVNCTEFTKSELNGCSTLIIRASYNLLGIDIEQIQFAIEVGKDKVTTITYTQTAGGAWTDAFESCIDSVRVEKNGQNSGIDRADIEITFRDIPWGTSFTEANSMLPDLDLWAINGESYKTMSIDDIVLGDYKGLDFEYSDINIIGFSIDDEIDVAGYTTSEVNLYFAYIPVNGVLTKTEEDSALYGARYVFEPKNLNDMSEDLISKISNLYGEPAKTTYDTDIFGGKYTYVYWYGQNDTELVLRIEDYSEDTVGLSDDQIVVSYVWLKGDELLQTASDILKEEAISQESNVYGNGSTNGL